MTIELENFKSLVYSPFESMSFKYDSCFLCGHKLKNDKSREHIFPKWLQKKFNLWDQTISLLNKSQISYRNLTIPCCYECNNYYLSRVEKRISNALKGGYEEFLKLDELTIYQWISKIYYGLLFKELSLSVDQKDPQKGFIINPENLERYKALHLFLQSIRVPMEFVNFKPWSIFIVKNHCYGDDRDFYYHDIYTTVTFSICMGEVGIIASLGDNGIIKNRLQKDFKYLKGISLHEIQFSELSALVSYNSYIINDLPIYISLSKDDNSKINILLTPSLTGEPVYKKFDHKIYALFLQHYWRNWDFDFNFIFMEPDLTRSYLKNERGEICVLNKDGNLDSTISIV